MKILNHTIKLLEITAAELASDPDRERSEAGRDLLQEIWHSQELLNDNLFMEADAILEQVAVQINHLMESMWR